MHILTTLNSFFRESFMKFKRILLSVSLLISSAYAQKHVEYIQPAKGDDVIGEIMYVTPKRHESLVDLTIRYEMGYEELKWANPGINAWMLSDTAPLVLPTQFILPAGKRSGIVSNIPEMRTYYFLKDSDKVYVYPVGVGRMDWKTPLGSWAITRKQENPAWYPPESIRKEHVEMGRGVLPKVVPAGPDNPLGTRVLRLALPSYLLHGTNEQTGIGMRVTHGCMRFYPQHIEHIYEMVPTNTMVTFLNEPVKYGFLGNDLLIEVHPPLEEDELSTAELQNNALALLEKYLEPYPESSVNYDMVKLAVQQQSGIPVIVGQKVASSRSQAPQVSQQADHQSLPVLISTEAETHSAPIYQEKVEQIIHQVPAKEAASISLQPKVNQKVPTNGELIIQQEIRLTPDPATIIVPESVPDEEVMFPEPSSYRFNY